MNSSSNAQSLLERAPIVFVIALFIAFLIKAGLASSENLLWMDEVYSLELATKPVEVIVDLTSQDVHPPLYYLALKGWLAASGQLSGRTSLFQARALNIAVWLALGALLLPTCRRLFGPTWGEVAAVGVLLSSPCVQLTQDLRGYGLAFAGVTYCFAVSSLALRFPSQDLASAARRWIGYTISAGVAVWSHLLAWPLLGLIALSYFLGRWRSGSARRSRLDLAVAGSAHLLLLLAGLPWLVAIPRQIRYLESSPPTWMTPPTLSNLARVFGEWLPLGRDGAAGTGVGGFALVVGLATLLPFAGMLATRRKLGPSPGVGGEFWSGRRVAFGALAIALLYVGTLWAGARWGWIHAFHGPRYPGLAGGIWALGLVAASRDLSAPSGRRAVGALLIAPWFASSLLAMVAMYRLESASGERSFAWQVQERVRGTGRLVVFSPPELEPFFPRTIYSLDARRLAAMPCLLAGGQDVVLFLANRWKELDTPTSLLLHTAIAYGRLGATSRAPIPVETGDFSLTQIAAGDSDLGLTEAWCKQGLSAESRGTLAPGAIEVDLASQLLSNGWSYLEFDRELRPLRWTSGTSARLRLPEERPEGGFDLVVEGTIPEGPGALVLRRAGLFGSRDEVIRPIPPGRFSVALTSAETAGLGSDREVEIRCSTLRDSGSPEGFRRTVGAQIRRVYLAPSR